jgi:8-oxo-dGTP pyrophosphatase MutT (NUDIX family)
MKTFREFLAERKFWGEEAAGTVFVANDTKRILFLKRSGEEDSEQGQWEITVGGKRDPEDLDIAATRDREAGEELGVEVDVLRVVSLEVFFGVGDDHRRFKYHSYAKVVPAEFEPTLSDEHSAYKWVDVRSEEIPSPLHFGADHLINRSIVLNDLLSGTETADEIRGKFG